MLVKDINGRETLINLTQITTAYSGPESYIVNFADRTHVELQFEEASKLISVLVDRCVNADGEVSDEALALNRVVEN